MYGDAIHVTADGGAVVVGFHLASRMVMTLCLVSLAANGTTSWARWHKDVRGLRVVDVSVRGEIVVATGGDATSRGVSMFRPDSTLMWRTEMGIDASDVKVAPDGSIRVLTTRWTWG